MRLSAQEIEEQRDRPEPNTVRKVAPFGKRCLICLNAATVSYYSFTYCDEHDPDDPDFEPEAHEQEVIAIYLCAYESDEPTN